MFLKGHLIFYLTSFFILIKEAFRILWANMIS